MEIKLEKKKLIKHDNNAILFVMLDRKEVHINNEIKAKKKFEITHTYIHTRTHIKYAV